MLQCMAWCCKSEYSKALKNHFCKLWQHFAKFWNVLVGCWRVWQGFASFLKAFVRIVYVWQGLKMSSKVWFGQIFSVWQGFKSMDGWILQDLQNCGLCCMVWKYKLWLTHTLGIKETTWKRHLLWYIIDISLKRSVNLYGQ